MELIYIHTQSEKLKIQGLSSARPLLPARQLVIGALGWAQAGAGRSAVRERAHGRCRW